MTTAVALTLIFAALTAAYFILVNVQNFRKNHRAADLWGAAWSLVLTAWFGYAAAWVLQYVR